MRYNTKFLIRFTWPESMLKLVSSSGLFDRGPLLYISANVSTLRKSANELQHCDIRVSVEARFALMMVANDTVETSADC